MSAIACAAQDVSNSAMNSAPPSTWMVRSENGSLACSSARKSHPVECTKVASFRSLQRHQGHGVDWEQIARRLRLARLRFADGAGSCMAAVGPESRRSRLHEPAPPLQVAQDAPAPGDGVGETVPLAHDRQL